MSPGTGDSEHDFTDLDTLSGLYDCVRELEAERDRLRAVVDAARAMWDDLTAVDENGTQYQFPAAHYAPIDDGLDALGLLDVSPTGENENTVGIGGQVMTQAQYDAARFPLVDERDRLRAVVMGVRECDNCPACQQLALEALDISPDMGSD